MGRSGTSRAVFGASLVFLTFFGASGVQGAATDEEVVSRLGKLLEKVSQSQPAWRWASYFEMVDLARRPVLMAGEEGGKIDAEATKKRQEKINQYLTGRLEDADEQVRLAVARALCDINRWGKADEQDAPAQRGGLALARMIYQARSEEAQLGAAWSIGKAKSLYRSPGQAAPSAVEKALEEALPQASGKVRIAGAVSLMRISGGLNPKGESTLREMMRQAEKPLDDEAALALAENGLEDDPQVKLRLYYLYREPTPNGERAAHLLKNALKRSRLLKEAAGGEQLLREIYQLIKEVYPDPDKVDPRKLFESAAQGMVSALDRFSAYQGESEVKEAEEKLGQEYEGIGAYVGMRDGFFVIVSPIPGSPAQRAGLKSMDRVLEVDGQKVSDLLEEGGMTRVIARIKGRAGTFVRLKIHRRGWLSAVELTVTRGHIQIKTVLHELLPGGIGYLQLNSFAKKSHQELHEAIEKMKKAGLKGLLLDLRDNGGGLLSSACLVAEMFLPPDKLLVFSKGRDSRHDHRSTRDGYQFPMVVLINSGSASASEIVAGCLKDYERALLVGETTFGKGSVQQLFPLQATEGKTQLKLTNSLWYLPLGESIHEKGVKPHLEVVAPLQPAWKLQAILELRKDDAQHSGDVFERYLDQALAPQLQRLVQFAYHDPAATDVLSDWEQWRATQKSDLPEKILREEIRHELRARLRPPKEKAGQTYPKVPPEHKEQIERLRQSDLIGQYVDRLLKTALKHLAELASFDGGRTTGYEGFGEFYRSLKTHLEEEDIRQQLRWQLRSRLQTVLREEYACDVQDDVVLRRGLFELLKKLQLDPAQFAEYRAMPQEFAQAAKAVADPPPTLETPQPQREAEPETVR